jgi:hypothetical protein
MFLTTARSGAVGIGIGIGITLSPIHPFIVGILTKLQNDPNEQNQGTRQMG